MTAVPAMAAGLPLPRAASSTSTRRLAFSILNFLAITNFVQFAMAQNSFVHAVYYPNWHAYKGKTPAKMELGLVTHVIYSFMAVNTNGALETTDNHADRVLDVDGSKGGLAALAKVKADNPGLKTLFSVGGANNSKEFPAMAANAEARTRFAREVKIFADEHNFNGVDIDWEHPKNEEQGKNYIALLEAVRKEMPQDKYQLTSALPPAKWALKYFDVKRAAAALDYMNLMCYDLTGPWTEVSGNHAQLFASSTLASKDATLRLSCADGVEYLTANGFPSRKIVMGIPAYARNFPASKGPGQSTAGSGEIDYGSLPQKYIDKAVIDDTAIAASYVDETDGFVTFDTPRTVTLKANYAKMKNLGGLFYWTGSGDRSGRDSLIKAGWNSMSTKVSHSTKNVGLRS
ncbi:glycosyl hydrolase family 18 [Colletotrichum truncatum]|uniref:Glycosyl hydrolase family 18 n=1 Tax=Colletotrichum truncatum TaxID=5467 RepID=A0ACC3YHJ9_COLTU|nr:glycosyl hydrolase family 18 [Colletotrichum truncatum]KAF6792885.1 glycosyl hydrolase family 18 [Colletotrichum truncatum]